MQNSKTTRFKKRICITEELYYWLLENKGKKSSAGFLDQVVEEYRKLNFKKKK